MGRFATGITVITSRHGAETWGMTANAVTSLSLDPPLVLVAVDKKSQTHAFLQQSRNFAVNILSDQQEPFSRRFASTGPKDLADLTCETAVTGAPLLPDTLGYLDCKLHSVLPGGDHDIFIGEIVAGDHREGRPLLYFSGKYAQLANA